MNIGLAVEFYSWIQRERDFCALVMKLYVAYLNGWLIIWKIGRNINLLYVTTWITNRNDYDQLLSLELVAHVMHVQYDTQSCTVCIDF